MPSVWRFYSEQLAVKQEQMAQNIATLQAVEGNQKEDVIPAFGPTISDQPRKPPKPSGNSSPAQSPPVPAPPPVARPSSRLRSRRGIALQGKEVGLYKRAFGARPGIDPLGYRRLPDPISAAPAHSSIGHR